MSIVGKNVTFLWVGLLFFIACDSSRSATLPQTTPDQVVIKFFGLLGDGGKLSNREALSMVSDRYAPVNPDSFRRWTENYSGETKIKILQTTLPTDPDEHGDWIATVKMQVLTPSLFGGDFATTSVINLILDKKKNTWAIDFLAQSIDEEEFRKASATAKSDG